MNLAGDCFYCYWQYRPIGGNLSFLFDDSVSPPNFLARHETYRTGKPAFLSGGQFSYDYDPLDSLDKLTKAVGLHIYDDSNGNTDVIKQPDNIPYDDDDNVVVLMPCEEPEEPIYINPTTFNEYIDNGTYTTINEGDTVNYFVDNSTVNNFTNIYNYYHYGLESDTDSGSSSGGYNDTNLINRLHNWFTSVLLKLDEIIDKLPSSANNPPDSDVASSDSDVDTSDIPTVGTWLPPWLSWLDPDPCYDNFTDCIFDNITILSLARDTLESLNNGLSSSESENTPALAGASSSDVDDNFNGFTAENLAGYVDYNRLVSPFVSVIRPVTTFLAYSLGIVSVWRSIKSVFGININVSDLSGADFSKLGDKFKS